ncbi:MAG: hypothetical protein UZ08_BCD001002573 [Candidatus Parvibacillus calidus]|nr:MAG: hypothetical protein UZ08_BCD001002573 [Candidatus Parvibacillus calidus]
MVDDILLKGIKDRVDYQSLLKNPDQRYKQNGSTSHYCNTN